MVFVLPSAAPMDESRLTYESDISPEEQVEQHYAPQLRRRFCTRPGDTVRAASARTQRSQPSPSPLPPPLCASSSAAAAASTPVGEPFHHCVWYPAGPRPASLPRPASAQHRPQQQQPQQPPPPPPAARRALGSHQAAVAQHAPNMRLAAASFFSEAVLVPDAALPPRPVRTAEAGDSGADADADADAAAGAEAEMETTAEETETVYKLGLAQYRRAAEGLGVEDHALTHRSYEALRGDNDWVYYHTLMRTLDAAVNGEGSDGFVREAFELFSTLGGAMQFSGVAPPGGFDASDFIHADKLVELRRQRLSPDTSQSSRMTHGMVKALLAHFACERRREEDTFVANMGKGKKGAKKKPVLMPPLRVREEMRSFHRARHVGYAAFRTAMVADPNMVAAFLPIALSRLSGQEARLVEVPRADYKSMRIRLTRRTPERMSF